MSERMVVYEYALNEEGEVPFKKLQEDTAIESPNELLEEALAFFELCVVEAKAGMAIASIDESSGTYTEVTTTALEQAKTPRTAH